MKRSLRPLSYFYRKVVEIKNSLYERSFFQIYRAPIKVISIGNITMGGTGKTPITDFCIKNLLRSGKTVAVISRSYRADAGSACKVDVSHPFAARYYGDEPVLLARSNPDVPVYVGPSKWKTAKFAVENGTYDVLLVDDGFQHLKLARDLNVVILDATEKLRNYAVVPEGRSRESWMSLQRADVILISKCNLASEENIHDLQKRLPSNKEVIKLGYKITHFKNERSLEVLSSDLLKNKKIFLVSAIARPEIFDRMMSEIGNVDKASMHFRDHHQYKQVDADSIAQAFRASGASYLIATEKDAVKLKSLLNEDIPLWSASLEVVELERPGRLHEIISQVLH